ncbi:MAG: hypothetical protein LKF83_10095, partial [Solobacterium sp.]|nr:hypothetical protein [Solobacterium sp.]
IALQSLPVHPYSSLTAFARSFLFKINIVVIKSPKSNCALISYRLFCRMGNQFHETFFHYERREKKRA